jgi:radical SAM-linked protein
MGEIREKQHFLRQEIKKRKLRLKWQDATVSYLEGVFARGDRRLGKVLLKARELGCRFDGWGELFNFPAWQEAFVAVEIDPVFYHRRRGVAEILPWDHLDCGVTRDYLVAERDHAFDGSQTIDCRSGKCTGCGVCDFTKIKMQLIDQEFSQAGTGTPAEVEQLPAQPDSPASRIRLRFSKTGSMRFLSHLEMINLFIRSVGRSRIPIRFSQGFHPHPRFSFATALSVGVESWAEYMDMEVSSGFGADEVLKRLNEVLPEHMEIMEAREIPLQAESLSVIMAGVCYRVTLQQTPGLDLAGMADRFLALESSPFSRVKKGKTINIDLRRELLALKTSGNSLEMTVGRGKPLEFTAAITGLPQAELLEARIEKLAVIFRE